MFSASAGLTSSTIAVERAREVDAAQHLEALVGAAEVGLGVLDDAAERPPASRAAPPSTAVTSGSTGSPPRSRLQAIRSPRRSTSSSVAGAATAPGSRAGRAGRGRRAPDSSSATSCGVRAIGPSTGSGFHGSPGPCVRDPARRGPQADEAAERGRVAHARAEVGAVGERQHPARPRRPPRRRSTRPASCVQVLRVARGAEDRVERLRAGAELGRVRLADHDRARRARSRSTSSESASGRARRTAASRRSCASRPCPRGP